MIPSIANDSSEYIPLPWSWFTLSTILFVAIVATSYLGQYIFFTWHSSPAVIWPAAGISLAAVLMGGGYRMWVPIALASFVSAYLSPSQPTFLVVAGVTLAHTVTPVAGAYLLNRFGFDGTFNTMRSAFIFAASTLLVAAIAPSIIVAVQVLTYTLPDTLYVTWSRSWAGRVLSIMVLTPLLIAWLRGRHVSFGGKRDKLETAAVLGVLLVTVYLLFWTSFVESNSFLLLLSLLVAFFWVALRLNVRTMVTALFLLTAFGMAGPLFRPDVSANPVNQRLFSIELFIILVAPIFLAFSTAMKERRVASALLQGQVDQLEAAMRRLNAQDEAKNEFIAILAHELRNPLAAILSSTELLKLERAQTSGEAELLGTIDNRVRTMARLLDDLLDTSRISQHNFHLEKETVALCDIVDRSLATAGVTIRAHGHTLAVTKPPDKIYLEADPVRLEQIFVNLLNNAAKYTKQGGLIAVNIVREGDSAVVRVRDSGIGIPKTMLTRIFEPFFQVVGGKKGQGGLGIGLSLTRRLVEMHGGKITASSEGEGHGSEFSVQLPLPAHVLADVSADGRELRGGHRLRAVKHARRILVVDDNEAAASSLAKLLSLRGHTLSTAHSGLDALEKAREFAPQVVLLDVGMPDMDGYEVARKIKKGRKDPPLLVAVTGYGNADDKKRALAAGFDRHLVKPVGLKEVEAALRGLSRSKKQPVVA